MASPDFLCIGAQKAGTTWLHYMLRGHSDFWLPAVKELQFFNNYFLPDSLEWAGSSRLARAKDFISFNLSRSTIDWDGIRTAAFIAREEVDLVWYHSVFDLAPLGRIKGEITPEYSLLEREQIQALARLYPDLRILFGLRDPTSRIISAVRMLLHHQGYSSENEVQDYEQKAIDLACYPDNIIKSAYRTILERWAACFSPDRILCYDYDFIAEDPVRLLSGICRFFGAGEDRFRSNPRARIHPGRELEMGDKIMAVIQETHRENVREYNELKKFLNGGVATYAAML